MVLRFDATDLKLKALQAGRATAHNDSQQPKEKLNSACGEFGHKLTQHGVRRVGELRIAADILHSE